MEKGELSRREALGLAKFGVMLAAGLGVVETGLAQGDREMQLHKLELGSVVLKFYKVEASGATMFKSYTLPAVQAKQVLAEKTAQVTLKFWRPAMGSQSETVYTESILKLGQ